MSKYPTLISVLYWIIVTSVAFVWNTYAVFDIQYLITMIVGFVIWILWLNYIKKENVFKLSKIIIVSIIVIIISSIILHPIVVKDIQVKMPDNPFAHFDGESGTKTIRTTIISWQYWMPERVKQNVLSSVNTDRLIKYSQKEQYLVIRGIEKYLIVEAFGQPVNQKKEGEFEIWEYHPWSDQQDWVMPLYLKDNKLWSVGRTNDL